MPMRLAFQYSREINIDLSRIRDDLQWTRRISDKWFKSDGDLSRDKRRRKLLSVPNIAVESDFRTSGNFIIETIPQ